jgi:anthranilate phosphoribosyltransferase
MDIKATIAKLMNSESLAETEAFDAASVIMQGGASPAQIGAVLVSLRLKGETEDEVTGFARAMRSAATAVPCRFDGLVDSCGTGGDGSGTFNVSSVAALVAAGAGCRVAKHGNRSITSRCGSADLFAELGVNIDADPRITAECIDQIGLGFLFAPALHPAMKHAAGPRREIGVRTVFNILGPLTNPAGARRQVLGVFDGALTETLARVLLRLGSDHVLVVHGEDGLDEITLTGPTRISELKDGRIRSYILRPEEVGLSRAPLEAVLGGDAAHNASIARDVLSGSRGPHRDMVVLNAGAVVYAAGKAGSIGEGVAMAEAAIDSGRGIEKLEALKRKSLGGA